MAAFARFDANHHAVSADTDREPLEGHRQPDRLSHWQASVALEVHAASADVLRHSFPAVTLSHALPAQTRTDRVAICAPAVENAHFQRINPRSSCEQILAGPTGTHGSRPRSCDRSTQHLLGARG